ncbi:hypothetical protein CBL_05854 [Carabus blaptoides fortunei]
MAETPGSCQSAIINIATASTNTASQPSAAGLPNAAVPGRVTADHYVVLCIHNTGITPEVVSAPVSRDIIPLTVSQTVGVCHRRFAAFGSAMPRGRGPANNLELRAKLQLSSDPSYMSWLARDNTNNTLGPANLLLYTYTFEKVIHALSTTIGGRGTVFVTTAKAIAADQIANTIMCTAGFPTGSDYDSQQNNSSSICW